MATNHTTNYALNLWEPTDAFLREEFNENTQKIDAALDNFKYVTGSYNGGAERIINLGFRPKLVLIISSSRFAAITESRGFSAGSDTYGGASHSSPSIQFTDDGFTVDAGDRHINASGFQYSYIAFR